MPPRAKKGSNKNKSNKGSAVTSGSNSGTKSSTSVDASLAKCDHCSVKLPKEWISSFQSITNCSWTNNKAARLCGGCAQAYEAYTESFAKCASCKCSLVSAKKSSLYFFMLVVVVSSTYSHMNIFFDHLFIYFLNRQFTSTKLEHSPVHTYTWSCSWTKAGRRTTIQIIITHLLRGMPLHQIL